MDRGDVLTTLQHLLLDFYNRSINVVLAIDEAQNMPEATLEDLRVLSNLETRSDKLLQIVLVGQPELDVILSKSSLRQLSQRIAARATIPALSLKQSFRYIRHRVTVAGRAESNPLFSVAALSYIAFVARGNPRTLNIYCDNALMNGLGHHSELITLPIAREALRQFRQSNPRPLWRLWWIAALAVFAVLGVLGGTSLRSSVQAWPARPTERPVRTASALVPSAQRNATPPTIDAAISVRTSAPGESLAPTASGTDSVGGTATSPSATSGVGASLTSSTTESIGATSAVDTVRAPSPTLEGPAVRKNAAATSRHDSNTTVVVRPGDRLLRLCRDAYGKCDRKTLQLVLHANPRIRSANVIASGDSLMFPPHRQSDTH
jgi:general secretion pathway protein A